MSLPNIQTAAGSRSRTLPAIPGDLAGGGGPSSSGDSMEVNVSRAASASPTLSSRWQDLFFTPDLDYGYILDTIRAHSPLNHIYEEIAASGNGFELDEEQVMSVPLIICVLIFSFSPCSVGT